MKKADGKTWRQNYCKAAGPRTGRVRQLKLSGRVGWVSLAPSSSLFGKEGQAGDFPQVFDNKTTYNHISPAPKPALQ